MSLRQNLARDSAQCRNQIIHHNLCHRSTPISASEINQDSLHVTTRYMEKDKWSQTVKAFQLSIGVPDNGLGQVGLYYSKGILSFALIPVPNYLTSYPFSFIRVCVCISVGSLIVCLSAKTAGQNNEGIRQDNTKQRKD